MKKQLIERLARESGKNVRTVTRALESLRLSAKQDLDDTVKDLIIIYLRIDGPNKSGLRASLSQRIYCLDQSAQVGLDTEFKDYLIAQSALKDKQLLKKDKQIARHSKAIVGLSNKLVTLVDDISMLRVQDTGTVQRLYDKNVLADLLTDLEPGSAAHSAVEQLLKKLNAPG